MRHCDALNSICRRCCRRALFAAVFSVVMLPVAAIAQEVPQDRTSLIQLGSRVFDMGTDVRHMPRDPHFIPVTDVRWINALVNGDPYLRYTVIHVDLVIGFLGTPVWLPNEDRGQYAPAEDLADARVVPDYDVRWRHKVAPSTRGDIVLFPKSPDAGYYVSCGYDRADPVPTFCAGYALYPPDSGLRVTIRIYKITDPLNDFRTVVDRALNPVYCLDVTRAVAVGTWQLMAAGKPQSLAEFLATCRNVSS